MQIETRKIITALEKKGFVKDNGDHQYFHLFYNGKKLSIFTKISHGAKEYGDGLIGKVHRQMGLSKQEFLSFIDCTLEFIPYLRLLLSKKKIAIVLPKEEDSAEETLTKKS